MLAQFTGYLQARFAQGRLPWEWCADDNITKIHILAEFAIERDTQAVSPSVVVSRGAVVHQRNVVADRDQNSMEELTKGGTQHWGTGEMDILMQCIGQTKGEASIIGDIVQSSISMARNPLCEAFTLRDIGPVLLGRTVPYERDETKYMSPVSFRVFFEQRWFVIPGAPSLQGIEVQTRFNEEAATYVKTLVLKIPTA